MQRVRPVSITHPDHHVNVARRRAAEEQGAVFADQFENAANLRSGLPCSCRPPDVHLVRDIYDGVLRAQALFP